MLRMLSRRQLRIRVMQALYAYFQHNTKDVSTAQMDLLKGNERSYDLYLQLLSLLPELARIEQIQRKDAPKKCRGSCRFPESSLEQNLFIKWLAADAGFNEKIRKRNIGWQNDQDMINKFFFDLRNENRYKEYISNSLHDEKFQIDFCKWIIQFAKGNEVFAHAIEEKNIFWAESIELIASMAERTISNFDVSNYYKNKLMDMYRDTDDDTEFMRKLVSSVISNDEFYTQIIADKTKNWEVDRIAILDVILLKMALAEATCFENIPIKVTINVCVGAGTREPDGKTAQTQ